MAYFSDTDAVERSIGKPVADMTADELVSYVKTYMAALHQVSMAVDGVKERSIMTALKRVYGNDAGPLVKWVFYRHDGKNDKGKLVRFFDFQKSEKWWLDQLHMEMQIHQQRAAERASRPRLTPLSVLR